MRNAFRSNRPWFLATIGCLGLLTGCAVMEVTVDVYKGPLSNHRDVQMEQSVAAVIGAKPLLVQLRDQLEYGTPVVPASTGTKGAEHLFHHETLSQNLVRFRTGNTNYRSGYISTERYKFTNQLADRVNSVLSLYEDQVSTELSAHFREAFSAFENYALAYSIFRPTNNASDLKAWNQLSGGLTARSSADTNDAVRWKKLRADYERFLTNPKRELSDLLSSLAGPNDNVRLQGIAVPTNSNARFDLLATNLVQRDADFLYGTNDSRTKAAFISRVQLIAGSFRDSRVALDRLLVASLKALATAGPQRGSDSDSKLAEDLVAVVVSVVQVHHLGELIEPRQRQKFGGNVDALAVRAGAALGVISSALGGTYTPESLGTALRMDPASMSLALLQLHTATKFWAAQAASNGNNSDAAMLRHGLVRGPTADVRELQPGEIDSSLYAAAHVIANGYDRGRLLMGIETLVEQYLETFVTAMNRQPLREERRALLLNALIGFSEKLRTLSNFSALAGGEASDFREYVAVLQAVGNSILIQIDEIRQQTQHQQRLRESGANELAAIASSAIITNALALTNLDNILGKAGSNDVHQVQERLLSLLQYEYAAALRVDGTNTSKVHQLRQAIDVVSQIHNDSVYLRPAAAYLRNSYPATVLQGDSSAVGWRNMIGEHMFRGTPGLNLISTLFPRIAGVGVGAKTHRLQRDIDKQYWQNINRVRVAGSGDANYVIAKDDVGNWYVKSYSVNSSNIYASAASLAQLALGGALKTDIPLDITKTTVNETNQGTTGLSEAIGRQVTATGKSFDDRVAAVITEFQNAATNQISAFTNTWSKLTTNQSAWTTNVVTFSKAVEEHFTPLVGKMTPRGEKTLMDGLVGLRRLYHAIDGGRHIFEGVGSGVDADWQRAVGPVLQKYSETYERLQREQKASLETLSALQ